MTKYLILERAGRLTLIGPFSDPVALYDEIIKSRGRYTATVVGITTPSTYQESQEMSMKQATFGNLKHPQAVIEKVGQMRGFIRLEGEDGVTVAAQPDLLAEIRAEIELIEGAKVADPESPNESE